MHHHRALTFFRSRNTKLPKDSRSIKRASPLTDRTEPTKPSRSQQPSVIISAIEYSIQHSDKKQKIPLSYEKPAALVSLSIFVPREQYSSQSHSAAENPCRPRRRPVFQRTLRFVSCVWAVKVNGFRWKHLLPQCTLYKQVSQTFSPTQTV